MVTPFSAFPRLNTIQLANQPWSRNANDVYGRKRRLTFSEAIGVTGGTQTTNLDASINGKFFGKFVNVAHHMGNADGPGLLAHNYPSAVCTQWLLGDSPHAEDYLLAALETEWLASNSWVTRYPYQGGQLQQKSLLSIRMNRSPCPRCAKNLHRYCRLRNISLRVKATFFHSDTDAKGRTGTALLDSKQRPVRQWDTARIIARAPTGHPANMAVWEANQLAKKSNPYRYEGRDDVEDANEVLFTAQRVNHNVPLLTGWGAAVGNLSRATIQNKAVRQPPAPAPFASRVAAQRTGVAPPAYCAPGSGVLLRVPRFVPAPGPVPPWVQAKPAGPAGAAAPARLFATGLTKAQPLPKPRKP